MDNKSLLTDFYQLTMAYSYFKQERFEEYAYFDMFYRKNPDQGGFVISNGLDAVIEYIHSLRFSQSDIDFLRDKGLFDEAFLAYLKKFKFNGDVYAVEDGTVVFPHEPLITVRANIIEAQIIETRVLLLMNYASLVTTKASRVVRSAKGKAVLEFGTRRAQGESAAIEGAKYAYIGGCTATACVEAEKLYGVPSGGTMAHSYVEAHDSEYDAFLNYATTYPDNTVLLVDTYDTLESGVKNAIRVAYDYLIPNGYRLKAIRLDSGDLAFLSKEARKRLDAAQLYDCKIIASNSLDEYIIKDLIQQEACIDIFGVGENLITSKSSPVFGGVYKLVAIEKDGTIVPKIKVSDNVEKIVNPGYKKVYRFYDKDTKMALGDVITLHDETVPGNEYTLLDPSHNWRKKKIQNYTVCELQEPIFKQGKLIYNLPSIEVRKKRVEQQLTTIAREIKRFKNPHLYLVNTSKKLYHLKNDMLEAQKAKILEEFDNE